MGTGGGPATLYPKDFVNFAPRFSLVDDLLGNGKLVVRTGVGIFYDGASQDFFVGNQPWNTYAAQAGPAFNNIQFSSRQPRRFRAARRSSTPAPTVRTRRSPSARPTATPRYVSYNLNLESQVTKKIAVQVGYVGSQGRHLYHFRDIDQFNNVSGTVDNCGNGTHQLRQPVLPQLLLREPD